MSKAIILGCSHAAGAEIRFTPGIDIEDPLEQTEFEAQNSYPVLLANLLGYTPHNHAISGGSNDAMFRIFTEQFDTLTSQDIVIACWTGFNRSELWHENHQYWTPMRYNEMMYQSRPNDVMKQGVYINKPIVDESLYKSYGKQWLIFEGNDFRGRLNKIKNILALNFLAKSANVRVINIDSFMPVFDFQWPSDLYWPDVEDFCCWAKKNNQSCTAAGHFYLSSHQQYAELLSDRSSAG